MSAAAQTLDIDAAVLERRDAVARLLKKWQKRFAPDWVIATSLGPQSLAVIETAVASGMELPVAFIDTGFHFDETLRLLDRVQSYFGIKIQVVRHERSAAEAAAEKSEPLWESSTDACCGKNKIEPMRQVLAGKNAWITGLRRLQVGVRGVVQEEQWDPQFRMTKLSPLASWSRDDVVAHLQAFSIPSNPLLQDGYPSIGCEPCTSRYAGNDERGGRWTGLAKSECGLHLPVYQPNTASDFPPDAEGD